MSMLGKEKLDTLVEAAFATMEDELDDSAFVGVAMLVVEARDPDGFTAFYTFCTDKRQWVQRAAAQEAQQAIEFEEVEADGD